MFNLSKRLSVILNLVKDGATVADIGTDHAYLPIALIKKGKAKKVIACDIKEKPLLLARKNLDKSGCCFVETRLCDGLEGIKQGEADCIVIAGMGGEVIADILSRCPFKIDADLTLLLQPMTCAGELRKYLCENGFSYSETALCDANKLYTVFCVKYCGEKRKITPKEFFIGNLCANTKEELLYINKQLKIIESCLKGIKDIEEQRSKYLFYLEAQKAIKPLTE